MSPVATGKVYVVNTTNQLMSLILNNTALSDLGPAGGEEQGYAPTSISVPRSNANRIYDPVFAEDNFFQVMFHGVLNSYQIKIPLEQYPSNNDLWLYVFYNYLVLSDSVTNAIIFGSAPMPSTNSSG